MKYSIAALFLLLASPALALDLSLNPGAWDTRPAEGSTTGPARIQSPWSLTIPKLPKKVGYVEKVYTNISSATKLRMEFDVTGSGTITASDGGSPAKVALYFSRPGDNGLCGDQTNPNDPAQYKYRWWSVARVTLTVPTPTTVVFEVPLTPDKWKSCWGRLGNLNAASLAGFNAAKVSDAIVGFTFGANSAGHGISTTGNIQFKLKKYSVQ